MPKSAVGSRSFQTTPISTKAKEGYAALIKALLSDDADREPIELSAEARTVLESLFNEIEGRLNNDLSDITDWAGKFVGAVLRIASILHVTVSEMVHRRCGN